VGLSEKQSKKLRRECHEYDFGRPYPNVKVDNDGEKYHLWWDTEGEAEKMICTAETTAFSKGQFRPVCKFLKGTKEDSGGRYDKVQVSLDRAPVIVFNDLEKYFHCELREYDHKADWYDTAFVCNPRRKIVAKMSKK